MSAVDYDLTACLENNPQDGFTADDVDAVLANIEGEHDGAAYWWLLRLKDGRIAVLCGACDYTGWDCQSWATSVIAATSAEALRDAPLDVRATLSGQEHAGRAITRRENVAAALFGNSEPAQ